ncbi:hypothetical protein PPERSA_09527 [Pseudocohnilembus persalinus]|uniref:Uncharacterized protein n=1 Tax=Pseudocohnilembus persalinus TaxID=266149 RepID=A0A0V0QFF1_PSEPJ|nr:hypothetical protein PPERSA_09527 [Pseudocohnilembus persalinus]|eukprot:KRX00921.1 hypothetical protein PPERSA_09527 [Pseudocohnilembus persalinus]
MSSKITKYNLNSKKQLFAKGESYGSTSTANTRSNISSNCKINKENETQQSSQTSICLKALEIKLNQESPKMMELSKQSKYQLTEKKQEINLNFSRTNSLASSSSDCSSISFGSECSIQKQLNQQSNRKQQQRKKSDIIIRQENEIQVQQNKQQIKSQQQIKINLNFNCEDNYNNKEIVQGDLQNVQDEKTDSLEQIEETILQCKKRELQVYYKKFKKQSSSINDRDQYESFLLKKKVLKNQIMVKLNKQFSKSELMKKRALKLSQQ